MDDIVLLARKENKEQLEEIINQIKAQIEVRDLGELEWFLGIRVVRNRREGKIWLLQDAYIDKIAYKFGCTHFTKTFTPLPYIPGPNTGPPLSPESQKEYSELLGSALYPGVITRADIALATSVLANFAVNPTNEHLFLGKQLVAIYTIRNTLPFSIPQRTVAPVLMSSSLFATRPLLMTP